MDSVVSPSLLYLACALGAVGVGIALPRDPGSGEGKRYPAAIGAIIAAVAGGLFMLAASFAAARGVWGGDEGGLRAVVNALPNLNFYVFSLIALAAGLRMITHRRPVYSALYFVLTILSSAGLYVLLSAEFLAFALVIVYAGAILITYLFVIMLAMQAPSEDEAEDAMADYDRAAREPVVAAALGFALVAGLTTMMAWGLGTRGEADYAAQSAEAELAGRERLALLPGRVERALRDDGVIDSQDAVLRGAGMIDASAWTARVGPKDRADELSAALTSGEATPAQLAVVRTVDLPEDLTLSNVEGVAFALLSDLPGAIEIAGVILLMALVGAVVLARKRVQIDEALRAASAARRLSAGVDAS